jgi:hypothetical protein
MKKEKLSLKGIKNELSRTEMRKIMAGSGPCKGPGETCDDYYTFCCSIWTCVAGFNGGHCS